MDQSDPKLTQGNILIIDDLVENLRLLVDILSGQGYTVRAARDGHQGLLTAQNSPPDLILLDVMMPQIDGYEVCRRLKQDPRTQNIPVVFISALDEVVDKIKGFEVGGVDYISKPFQAEEVLARANLQLQVQQLRHKLEEQKRTAEIANRAKSTFLANMSHELRTPLNAILGFSQVLQFDTNLTETQQEQIELIHRSGQHLLTLIADILDISKIEAGKVTYEVSEFELRSLLDELEALFRLQADRKGINLIFSYGENLPRLLQSDRNKLRQILTNLLSNAIKFTTRGQVVLRTQKQGSPQQGSLQIDVEDTGIGIAPGELQDIFQPFVQTESGHASPEGTGLGLAISRHYAQLLGGDLTVVSQVGQGSVFTLTLPIHGSSIPQLNPTGSTGDKLTHPILLPQ